MGEDQSEDGSLNTIPVSTGLLAGIIGAFVVGIATSEPIAGGAPSPRSLAGAWPIGKAKAPKARMHKPEAKLSPAVLGHGNQSTAQFAAGASPEIRKHRSDLE